MNIGDKIRESVDIIILHLMQQILIREVSAILFNYLLIQNT